MIVMNYMIDPAGLFHDDSKAIAQSILSGNNTLLLYGNIDEREVKHQLIVNMPEQVECIAIGPSLVMGVRQGDVGTNSFYNLGESGADFYDILAQFGIMELNNKHYERVIFCVDSYFFDENLNKTFTRNKELKPYAQYMLKILDGETANAPTVERNYWRNCTQLVSPSYFQSALHLVKKEGIKPFAMNDSRWSTVNDGVFEDAYYMSDGSWVYGLKTQKMDERDVVRESNGYDIEKQFSKGKHIGNYQQEIFEKLVCYLQARNVRVDLYLCPLPPTLWDRVDNSDYHVLNELENFAHDISERYNLKLTGSYNPYKLGMSDSDFYDSRHVRHELLSKYFDFKQ